MHLPIHIKLALKKMERRVIILCSVVFGILNFKVLPTPQFFVACVSEDSPVCLNATANFESSLISSAALNSSARCDSRCQVEQTCQSSSKFTIQSTHCC